MEDSVRAQDRAQSPEELLLLTQYRYCSEMQHLVRTLMKNYMFAINWKTNVAIYKASKLGKKRQKIIPFSIIKQKPQIFFWTFIFSSLYLTQRFYITLLLAALLPPPLKGPASASTEINSSSPSGFSGAGTNSKLELKSAAVRKLSRSWQPLHRDRHSLSSIYCTVQAFTAHRRELKLKGQKYLLPLGIRSLSGMKSLYP